VNFQESSFKRPSHRILFKGLLGKYARSLRNYGYYAAKKKNLIFDHSFFLNLAMCPLKVKLRKGVDVWSSKKVNLFSRKFQYSNSTLYSLPLTSRCKFDGIVPYFRNRVKQTVDLGDFDFIKFNLDYVNKINEPGESHMTYMGMPGYEGMMEDLKKYTVPIEHQITKEDIVMALDHLKNIVELPKLTAPSKGQLVGTYVNDKSYSGLMTSLMAGHSKKESLEFSTILAEKMFDVVGSRTHVDTSLKVVGAREKLVKSDKFGSKMQTRALLQEESCISQLKQLYSRPITEAFKKLNLKWDHQIGIGGVLIGSAVSHFVNRYYPDDGTNYNIVTMDAASHDKNVCRELIVAAYSILRGCFPKSSVIDNHFFFFMSGHVSKRVMTDDGMVYNIEGGIQTGDPFTSLINSFCMLLEKTILYNKLNIKQPFKQVYYGDDQWELFDPDVAIPSNIGEVSKELLGIKMKDVIVKNSLEEFSDDYKSEPSFLQIFFKYGLPLRDPMRIFEKLYFMDPKLRDYPEEKIEAVMSMCYSSQGFNYTYDLVYNYAVYLKIKYNVELSYSIKERMENITMHLATSNVGSFSSNVRGEYVYKRKSKVYCDMFKYTLMKSTVVNVSPVMISHILGMVRFKNLQEVVLKYKDHKNYLKTIKELFLRRERYKQRNNLHWFLTNSSEVVGNGKIEDFS
jgi:hypothetical protein